MHPQSFAASAPATVELEVFVIGGDNSLWHKWQNAAGSSTWTDWTSLGGIGIKGNPAAAINSDGRLEVFVIGSGDNGLWHRRQTAAGSSSTWSSWESLGAASTGIANSPAVAINSDGRLEVFVVDNNTGLWHKWQTAAGGGGGGE